MKKYDVTVVGGGFAGVGAAVSAARGGASVLIIEKANCLGGAACNCLVNPFMATHTKIDGEVVDLSQGMYTEIKNLLDEYNARSHYTFREEELKLILNRLCQKEGVDLLYHARLYDAVCENGIVKSIKLACIGGTVELAADCFVDATGDAELAHFCGCPYQVGRPEDNLCQPMTLCFRVANVDIDKFFKNHGDMNKLFSEYQAQGKIKNPRENILVFYSPIKNALHFNTTRIIKKSPIDPFDVTQAEIEAREQAFEVLNFLREHSDGFENAEMEMTASQIGTRESRMILGDYVLNREDLIGCKRFDDAIAAGNYDIDIHNPSGTGTDHYYFPEGDYYTIPYRSLLPQKADNLIVAGRCISGDHDAQASFRIMPIVLCLGEAAGYAAAMAAKGDKNFRNVDVKKLQETLKEHGAFLGI